MRNIFEMFKIKLLNSSYLFENVSDMPSQFTIHFFFDKQNI